MMVFLNLGLKQAATGFPTGCLHDVLVPIRSPVLLQKQVESLGSGLEGAMELGKGG